jgi:signal transduction histidine kinase
VIGQDWFELFLPPPHDKMKKMFAELLANAPHAWHHANEILTKSGSRRTVRWNNSLLRSASGEVIGTASIAEDMTTNTELQQARAEADRANRAKSEFLSRMSHELRTPLNATLGFTRMLQRGPLDARQTECTEHILAAGTHLLSLINEVLEVGQIESGHISNNPVPLSVIIVAQETFALVNSMARRRDVRVGFGDTEPAPITIQADPQRLKQVFLNLIGNAIKYNKVGGTVTLSWEHAPGNRLRFSVIDTGLGMSPEQLVRLFTPFERLDAAQKGIEGTGLGLAVTRRLVEAMDGTVGVESEIGTGSTFWFEIPVEPDKVQVENCASAREGAILEV